MRISRRLTPPWPYASLARRKPDINTALMETRWMRGFHYAHYGIIGIPLISGLSALIFAKDNRRSRYCSLGDNCVRALLNVEFVGNVVRVECWFCGRICLFSNFCLILFYGRVWDVCMDVCANKFFVFGFGEARAI